MTIIAFNESDIDLHLAVRAHNGTSFVPEKRGRYYVTGYVEHMTQIAQEFEGYATDSNRQEVIADLEAYRLKYIQLLNAMLYAKSNCISAFIAGPSNFPVSRAQKASDSADKRVMEWLDYQNWKLGKLRRKYNPRLIAGRPIRLDDDDVVEQLEKKIAGLKRDQERMKAANKIVKSGKLTHDEKIDALVNEVNFSEKVAGELLTPDYSGWTGFPSYALSNNSANIRRLEGRLVEALAEHGRRDRLAERPADEYNAPAGVKVIENAEEVRIQLVFDGKPESRIRDILKSNGFRWSPTQGAWQRLLNANGRSSTRRVLGLIAK